MPETGTAGSRPPETTRRKLVFYPFLFSLYPVLFLYLHNIREVLWTQALWAAAASLGIAVAFWLATRLFSGRPEKRALLLFIFILLFHFYGLYYGQIAGLLPQLRASFLLQALAFVLPGGGCLLLSRAVIRSRKSFKKLNRILGMAVICLISWNLAGVLVHHGRTFLGQAGSRSSGSNSLANVRNGDPDIYCFILDEFAAIESARSLFHYDNSAFARSLQRQGFFVARHSRSPFQKTELALASFLNLGEYDGKSDPFKQVRRNAVAAFLKRRSYRLIEFPVTPALFMEGADQRHYYSLARFSIFFDDFYKTLFSRSLLYFLPERLSPGSPDSARYYREQVLQVFEELPAIVKSPGPKFVYVHLYCPHEPFVFNARGGAAVPGHFWDHADPDFYLQQYIFVSSKMTETVAKILNGSRRPPVIIIQSDHGYRGSRGRQKWQRKIDAAEAAKVFNALYLPGVFLDSIDPDLSPLNNFRLVFNSYFGTQYPLLRNP
jgi:hypothetical protein